MTEILDRLEHTFIVMILCLQRSYAWWKCRLWKCIGIEFAHWKRLSWPWSPKTYEFRTWYEVPQATNTILHKLREQRTHIQKSRWASAAYCLPQQTYAETTTRYLLQFYVLLDTVTLRMCSSKCANDEQNETAKNTGNFTRYNKYERHVPTVSEFLWTNQCTWTSQGSRVLNTA